MNIRTAKLFFGECRYQNIIVAKNGAQALAMFSDEIEFVLLDFGLPDIKGAEVCKEIRRRLNGKHLPIIGYTAMGDLDKNEWGGGNWN